MYSDGSYIYAVLEAEDVPKLWGIFFKPVEGGRFTRLGPDFTELPELWRSYRTHDSAEIALLALAEGYGLIPVDERGKVLCMAPQGPTREGIEAQRNLSFLTAGSATLCLKGRKKQAARGAQASSCGAQ